MKYSQLDLDLIARYNVKGPRYTSYPTALQFGPLDEQHYLEAISHSNFKDRNLSLYFHLPFCNTICYYCACNKIVTRDKSRARHYLDLLKKEIELQSSLFKGRRVSQLHWGGGTPTFLSDEEISELMGSISDHFNLVVDELGEFSIEVDPRTVNKDRIQHLRMVGFNRLSLGIQDFDSRVQKAINRIQSVDSTHEVIDAARENGFKSISVDLMYGLPYQSLTTLDKTLKDVIQLNPDRISIYNYAHLPDRFKSQRRIDALELPSAETKLSLLMHCIDSLDSAGYRYIGMDHFAKPDDELSIAQENGSLHRNFQGYSTFSDCDLVAMGITAISNIGSVFSQNVKELDQYENLINSGHVAIEKGIEVSRDDRIRRAVIMELICQFSLAFEDIDSRFDICFEEYFASELRQLQPLINDGLLNMENRNIEITTMGRLLSRNICMVFDQYINAHQDTQRFSKAI